MAVATVVAFGTTSMLTYPVLAHNYLPFEFSEQVGLFLGIAIHDTAQVMVMVMVMVMAMVMALLLPKCYCLLRTATNRYAHHTASV